MKVSGKRNESNRNGQAPDSAEEYYDLVFDSAPVMLHSISQDGSLVKVNQRWLAKLGYKKEEVLGRRLTDFLTEESRERALNKTLPLFWRVGSARSLGHQVVNKDGQVADLLIDAELRLDATGRPATIAALYGHDLLQSRQASATVMALRELARVQQPFEQNLPAPSGYLGVADHFPAGNSSGDRFDDASFPGKKMRSLSGRQHEVLKSMAAGARNREIAQELGISVRTVRFHIENIYQILGVQTRTHAVRVATELGLLKE